MDDEIDQLLKRLGLHRIREVFDRETARATTSGSSFRDFAAALLREQYAWQRERSFEYRVKVSRLPER